MIAAISAVATVPAGRCRSGKLRIKLGLRSRRPGVNNPNE
jgi:hypothetical protein